VYHSPLKVLLLASRLAFVTFDLHAMTLLLSLAATKKSMKPFGFQSLWNEYVRPHLYGGSEISLLIIT
jgi:hypothetical protein